MSTRTSAARYARALFDVARQEADLNLVRNQLASLVSAIAESRELSAVLSSRSVPEPIRRNIVVAVAQQLGVATPVEKLVGMLSDRGRLALLPEISQIYAERLLEHQNIVQAEVVSAAPLSAEAASRIEAGLKNATGKQVTMKVTVDPALLGGVVARVGSIVYDGSVRTQLKKMRDQLVAQG